MNKTLKAVLTGVCSFAVLFPALILIRRLISGKALADELKDVLNWAAAAIGGGSTGFSVWNKGKEGK